MNGLKRLKWVFGIVLCVFSLTVFADNPTNTLIMLLATTKNMMADFQQTITDNKGKVLQKSTGKMALLRPGQFRWDVKTPVRQLIVTNGSKLWIYDPDLNQVTIRSLTAEIGSTPSLLLSDPNHALTTDFLVQNSLRSNEKTHWFDLTPKNRDSMFSLIQLGFVMEKGIFIVRRMVLQDNLGHVTSIVFQDVVCDQPVSPDWFVFKPPANTDVIDGTQK